MLDIKYIRENTESVKQRLATRGTDYSALVDKAVALDGARRALIADNEEQKARQNAKNKEIPALKKAGQDVSAVFEDLRKSPAASRRTTRVRPSWKRSWRTCCSPSPTCPTSVCPSGRDDSENRGDAPLAASRRNFGFEPQGALGHRARTSASSTRRNGRQGQRRTRFRFLQAALGARLERVDHQLLPQHPHGRERVYRNRSPPFMVNRDSMYGTGQLPKFEEDAFRGQEHRLFPHSDGGSARHQYAPRRDSVRRGSCRSNTARIPPASAPKRAAPAATPAG